MSGWMASCEDITKLLSQSMDRRLPLRKRMEIRVHVMMCRFCSRYRKQMIYLSNLLQLHAAHKEEPDPTISLDSVARQRIKEALKKQANK